MFLLNGLKKRSSYGCFCDASGAFEPFMVEVSVCWFLHFVGYIAQEPYSVAETCYRLGYQYTKKKYTLHESIINAKVVRPTTVLLMNSMEQQRM